MDAGGVVTGDDEPRVRRRDLRDRDVAAAAAGRRGPRRRAVHRHVRASRAGVGRPARAVRRPGGEHRGDPAHGCVAAPRRGRRSGGSAPGDPATALPARQLRPLAAEPAGSRRRQPLRDQGARRDQARRSRASARFRRAVPRPRVRSRGNAPAHEPTRRGDGRHDRQAQHRPLPRRARRTRRRARGRGSRLHQGRRTAGQRPVRTAGRARPGRHAGARTPRRPHRRQTHVCLQHHRRHRPAGGEPRPRRRRRRHVRDGVRQPRRTRGTGLRPPARAGADPRPSHDVRSGQPIRAGGLLVPGMAEARPAVGCRSPAHQRDQQQVLRIRRRGARLHRGRARAAARTDPDRAGAVVRPMGAAWRTRPTPRSARPTCSCSPAAASTAIRTDRPQASAACARRGSPRRAARLPDSAVEASEALRRATETFGPVRGAVPTGV